jgi:hypothetical protein
VSEEQKQAIRLGIREAFASAVAPATIDEMLAEPFRDNEDAYEMAAAFVGKAWSEIPIVELFRHRESLFALSPAAYRAYLPAYLEASLASEDSLDKYGADIRGYLLYSLGTDTSSSPTRVATTRARIAGLDPAQRDAVVAVLHFLDKRWRMQDAADLLREWRRSD